MVTQVKMGFEGQLYYGVAGATATNLLENCKDISETFDHEKGNTTVRGASVLPPIETEAVTIRKHGLEWTMIHDTTDTFFAAMMAAVADGGAIALAGRDYDGGAIQFDGDYTITCRKGKPLNGEATRQFTASPNRSHGRSPILNG